MLVLSRKEGQSIEIAGGITITVVEIRGNRAWLGIVAPRETKVLRGELLPEVIELTIANGSIDCGLESVEVQL